MTPPPHQAMLTLPSIAWLKKSCFNIDPGGDFKDRPKSVPTILTGIVDSIIKGANYVQDATLKIQKDNVWCKMWWMPYFQGCLTYIVTQDGNRECCKVNYEHFATYVTSYSNSESDTITNMLHTFEELLFWHIQ